MEGYYEIIHRYLQIFDYVKKDETTEVYTASNLLPFTLYSESVKKCRKTHFIWDTNIFYSFVKEIKYFAVLKLITDDDVLHLKTELYQLLAMMEELSVTGEFSEGGKVCFYLSNIHFEATYSYIEKRDFQISLLRVYSINSMDSQSFYICRMQCNWIQSLKRHSILISESGEMQRMDFLQKQQAIIDSL